MTNEQDNVRVRERKKETPERKKECVLKKQKSLHVGKNLKGMHNEGYVKRAKNYLSLVPCLA